MAEPEPIPRNLVQEAVGQAEASLDSINRKRPLLQTLWENKQNILAAYIILAAFATGPFVLIGQLTNDQEVTEWGIKLLISSAVLGLTLGSLHLTRKGVNRLTDRFGDIVSSAYRDINGH